MPDSTAAELTLQELCSGLEYTHDRGEAPWMDEILTAGRYLNPPPPVDHFDVVVRGRLVRVTATDLGPAPAANP